MRPPATFFDSDLATGTQSFHLASCKNAHISIYSQDVRDFSNISFQSASL